MYAEIEARKLIGYGGPPVRTAADMTDDELAAIERQYGARFALRECPRCLRDLPLDSFRNSPEGTVGEVCALCVANEEANSVDNVDIDDSDVRPPPGG